VLYVEEGEPFDVAWYRKGSDLCRLVRGAGRVDDAEEWFGLERRTRVVPGDREAYERRIRELCSRASTEPSTIVQAVLTRREPIFDDDAALIFHHICASRGARSDELARIARSLFEKRQGDVPVMVLDPTPLLLDVLRHEFCDLAVLRAIVDEIYDEPWAERATLDGVESARWRRIIDPRVMRAIEDLVGGMTGEFAESGRRIRFGQIQWRLDWGAVLEALVDHPLADDVVLWVAVGELEGRKVPTEARARILVKMAGHPRADEMVRGRVRSAAEKLPIPWRARVVQALEKK
jgi:hypothetical protein